MLAKLLRKAKKAIVFVTIYAFLVATLPAYAYLPPISNAQMYTLATQGNVPALRAAVQRGLNIDTLDRYGNTALCHAILQRNYTAYNALRAAGANPYHPCVRNLRAGYYDSFLSSKRVVPTTANSREAYAYMGEDDFLFSPATWWTLGGILLGGALILIFSGGGGGSDNYFPVYKTTNYSLGALAGTNRPNYPSDVPYDPVILLEQNGGELVNGSGPDYNLGGDNPEGWVIANDGSIDVDGETKLLTDVIDFNTSALEYGDYIQAAMKGVYGSTVNNGYANDNPRYDPSKDYLITLGNNATALVALENSTANNYSKININAENGTVGMIASQNSTATNDINGQININYTGSKDNHGVIGMYTDTNSTIINNGIIMGQDHSAEPSAGTINGMRGQIINQELAPFSKAYATNNGRIELDIAADNRDVKTSLVGMGSWLEDEFLNGSMLLSRAGMVYLDNMGSILLNVALTGTGTYSASSEDGASYLMRGIGGIVGMRADGNTVATNGALIDIKITDTGDAENTVAENAAGMQSVHGGAITNNNTVNVTGGTGNFGLLAVRGEGSNSEFGNDSHEPRLNNYGTINVDSEGGFGMASFNGGGSVNTGNINLAKQGTGIQHDTGMIANSGKINLEQGGKGISMTQQGDITNELNGDIYIDNALSNTEASEGDGTDAAEQQESVGILQQNGNVINEGTITLVNTTGAENTISYGIKSIKGNVTSTNSITISDAQDSYGISAKQGNITNSGTVNINNSDGALDGNGYGLVTATGNIDNSGVISIANKDEAYAISTSNGNITNSAALNISGHKGTISSTAYGIQSAKGSVNNTAAITITDTKDSYAISANNGRITNSGNITLDNTSGALEGIGYGIQGGGYVPPSPTASDSDSEDTTGGSGETSSTSTGSGSSDITNTGTINIADKNQAYAIATANGDVNNSGAITLNGVQGALSELGYGIAVGNGAVDNSAAVTITNTNNSYAVAVENGDITNSGEINLYNKTGALEGIGYGLQSGRGDITSNADITIANKTEAYAISATNGNVDSNNAIVINNNTGANGSIAYGIQGGNGYINSNNTITINNANEGYGIYTSNGQVTSNADITLTNSQQAQNKTSYGIKADAGSVLNNADIYMNVTGDTTGEVSNESGSYGIWGGQANITNSVDSQIVFTLRGNGMYTESGSNDNFGTIHMQDGGTGMGTASGNATNQTNATITIDDTGVGMASGLGNATNNGTINITGTLSTGMESERYAVNNNVINVTGYNSKGMGVVADNAQIINNGQIMLNSDHNGLLNYGMYGEKGIYSRMVNNKDILITGREYPSTENIAYGMYLDEGEAKNYGNITLTKMFGYGMYLVSGGTLDNYADIALNYGGVGMGSGGTPTSPATVAMINHTGATITANGQFSYGMQGEGTATAWNDGTIEISGDDSYGIFTTNGSGTNTSSIVMNSSSNTGMHSVAADTINKSTGVITINGQNSVGMSTQDGGTSDTSKVGASNEGTINLATSATSSTGMTVLGSGVATNNNQINVQSTNSSGMWAQGESGMVTNAGTITVTGNESSGMMATAGTATNNKEILIQADDSYGMYANGDNAEIVNGMNGTIVIDDANDSKYAMYVKNGSGNNEGTLTFSKQGLVAMYVEKGSIENNRTINLSGDNSVAMQGAGENNATLTNVAGKDGPLDYEDLPDFSTDLGIIISGNNSTGMKAGGNTTATNDINGVITVNGPNSYGMVATGVTLGGKTIYGTAINNGLIIVNEASSQALYADGGIVQNGTSGMIYTNGSIAINVSSGTGTNLGIIRNDNGNFTAMYAEGGTIDNQGRITLNGDDSVGMEVNGSATATNSLETSKIEVNGANSIGMQAKKGTASNSGIINVNGGTGSVAMQADGGTITNESTGSLSSSVENGVLMLVNQGDGINNGKISLETMGITAMLAQSGAITNSSGATIALSGNNAVGMNAVNGMAQNDGNISVRGSNAIALEATGSGTATNNGQIDVTATDGYALYASNGGTIVNTSAGQINTVGSSAMYVAQGNARNEGNISNDNAGFHAIHLVNGSAENAGGTNGGAAGSIVLGGSNAVGIYAETGTVKNGGTITMNGDTDTFAIQVIGSGTVTNSGAITVTANGSSGTGIAAGGGTTENTGTITVSSKNGVGISNTAGSINNSGTVTLTGASSVGLTTNSGSLENVAGGLISVSGNNGIGMQNLSGGTSTNNGDINMTNADNAIGMYGSGNVNLNNGGNITLTGNEIIGMHADNGSTATNTGAINLYGSQVIAMKATNNSTIINAGTITYTNSVAGNTAGSEGIKIFSVDGTSSFINRGGTVAQISARGAMRLSSFGRVLMSRAANFTAANIEGNLGIDTTAIEGSETVFKNAVTTANASNLNVYGSAWFNNVSLVESEDKVDLSGLQDSINQAKEETLTLAAAKTTDTTDTYNTTDAAQSLATSTALSDDDFIKAEDLTNYDIVVKKGRLSNVLANNVGIEDRSVLDKLDNAYEAGAQSQVFAPMKAAYSTEALNTTVKKELGLDFFANFAKQNLDVIKSADRQINTAIFNNRSDKEVRFMTGYDFMSRHQKATAYLADYEDQAHSIFGMLDRKFNDHFRYGIGAVMSSLDSEYDSDVSSRDEVMFQILFPLTAQFENTKIVSVPRIGMGFGEYTRRTMSGKYEADTTNYYYGITNEARHNIDMGWFGLEPTLEFNVLGIRQNKIKENGALEVDASDSLSVEAGAGLYATKLFEFGEGHTLKLRAGGTIYHELADPYKAQTARLRDAGINYNINSYDPDRTRGILSLRVDYNYNKFNFYSEFNKYIESDDAYAINAGMGYKF